MWHLLYNAALLIASPIILAVLLAKQRCRRGLPQRLGWASGLSGLSGPSRVPDQPDRPNKPAPPVIWIHAVSLGEVVAVTPLVIELHRRHPECRLVVSTVTETGREAIEQRLAGVADHCYAPLDFPWVVSRFIGRLQPCLYLFIETELWPNLLWQLRRSGVPTALVNGRLSTRSFARQQWAPVRSFYRTMLQPLSLCLMQSDRDVDRMASHERAIHRLSASVAPRPDKCRGVRPRAVLSARPAALSLECADEGNRREAATVPMSRDLCAANSGAQRAAKIETMAYDPHLKVGHIARNRSGVRESALRPKSALYIDRRLAWEADRCSASLAFAISTMGSSFWAIHWPFLFEACSIARPQQQRRTSQRAADRPALASIERDFCNSLRTVDSRIAELSTKSQQAALMLHDCRAWPNCLSLLAFGARSMTLIPSTGTPSVSQLRTRNQYDFQWWDQWQPQPRVKVSREKSKKTPRVDHSLDHCNLQRGDAPPFAIFSRRRVQSPFISPGASRFLSPTATHPSERLCLD